MVGRVQRTLAPLRESPTLLHGDAHGENLPLLEDRSTVVLLDWPGPRLGLAACDLAAFVIMSYPPETRREVERVS
jgi:thiamine kinase-like enzyme